MHGFIKFLNMEIMFVTIVQSTILRSWKKLYIETTSIITGSRRNSSWSKFLWWIGMGSFKHQENDKWCKLSQFFCYLLKLSYPRSYQNNLINKSLFYIKFKRISYMKSLMPSTIKTQFHNALTHILQFVCTHRSRYETTSFEKEASIAKLTSFSERVEMLARLKVKD